MSEQAVPVAIVAAHAELAEGLISAVDAISGLGALLHPLSNRDLGGADLEAALGELLDRFGVHVIFTDLPGGSCAMAALRLARMRDGVRVVTGVNLPALLHFVGHAAEPTGDRDAVDRGVAALRLHPEAASAH